MDGVGAADQERHGNVVNGIGHHGDELTENQRVVGGFVQR